MINKDGAKLMNRKETIVLQRKLKQSKTKPKENPKPTKVNIKGAGRPTLMNIETLQKLEQAFLLGCTDDEACLLANISPRTLYNYQNENPDYVQQKVLWKHYPNVVARKSIVDNMPSRPDLALRYLEAKLSNEFNTKSTVNLEGTIEINFSQELKERIKQYEPRPIEATAVEVSSPDVAEVERGA